jgi:hypothetical protein
MGTTGRRRRLGLAFTFASSTALGPSNAVSAAGPAATACPRQGTVHLAPPLTMTSHDFSVVDLGIYGPCRMPDGSTRSAELEAHGTGSGSCANGQAAGRIRNGKRMQQDAEDPPPLTQKCARGRHVPCPHRHRRPAFDFRTGPDGSIVEARPC